MLTLRTPSTPHFQAVGYSDEDLSKAGYTSAEIADSDGSAAKTLGTPTKKQWLSPSKRAMVSGMGTPTKQQQQL